VVAVGPTSGSLDDGQCEVESWTDITQVAAGYAHTVGLKSDMTVVAVGNNDDGQCEVASWTGITQVAAGGYHTVGLKTDKTAVAVGSNDYGQCDVEGGTNILQVAAGGYHTVGVMTNKTVVAVGSNSSGQCNVNSWNLGDPCLLETIYGEFSPEAELLRYFRDHLLSTTPEGQELIRLYYQLSPGIVGLIEGDEPFRKEIKDLVDEMLPRLLQ
jgi:alpha-tubulin suppressor-like RCC1 family protein